MNDRMGESADVPQPGEVLSGKYEVEGTLGIGGMGVVLAARHLELGQRVAIKFMNAQFARHPTAVARFLREARASASIQSEHVARMHDVTRTPAGVPYLVMEYLVGTDLEKLVRERGSLPIEETVDYLLQACEAIAEAHTLGIVHRDLKPGNLFLSRRADGSPLVKVLDFGMSKMEAPEGAGADGNLTATSEILGSPWYMSPEQVRSTKNVDWRTDVWSLGVILHKLLTGTHAFPAPSVSSCLVKIVTEPPVSLRAKLPDAPADLEAVILRCLEKSVDQRLQNLAEFAWGLLPFAPERSRLSVERIVRVLQGSEMMSEKTIPLSAMAATAPSAIPDQDPRRFNRDLAAEAVNALSASPPAPPPVTAPLPVLEQQMEPQVSPVSEAELQPREAVAAPEISTAASATSTRLSVPRAATRWPAIVLGSGALLAGIVGVGARLFRTEPAEPLSSATATAASAAPVEATASALASTAPFPSASPPTAGASSGTASVPSASASSVVAPPPATDAPLNSASSLPTSSPSATAAQEPRPIPEPVPKKIVGVPKAAPAPDPYSETPAPPKANPPKADPPKADPPKPPAHPGVL